MTGKNHPGSEKATAFQNLRKQVEEKLTAGNKPLEDFLPSEMQALIRELCIHQVELEMQNEELRKRQAETEWSCKAFQDLWELSPVGYLIVDISGRVTAVNRAGQRLLGRKENALLKERFSMLVIPENQEPVHLMFERAAETGIAERQEIGILKPDGSVNTCLLEVRSLGGEPGREQIQAILTDITKKKRAEDDLRNNEQEKIAILNSLVEHVVYHDREMKILWANKAACESVRMKREDLLGRNCHEIWADRRTPCENCPIIKARDTGQAQMAEKMTPDGRWWHIKGHPVRDKKGHVTGMTELTLDITDRKRAEEALRNAKDELEIKVEERTADLIESNEKLRQEIKERKRAEKDLHETKNLLSEAFNAIQDSVVVIDKDLRVRISNWKGHDYISEKDRLGHPHCYEVFMHRKKPCRPCHAMEVFATGEIKQLEGTNPIDEKIRDIRVFPMFDDKGKVVAVIEHLRDITKLKQAEQALRENEEKYRQLFENESDAVMIFDAETGLFEDANRATMDLYGYSKDEFLALNVADISAEKEKTRSNVKKIRDGGAFPKQVPLRYFEKKDGTVFPGEISAGRFTIGGRQKIIGAVRNITKRMLAEQKLLESEQRFRGLFDNMSNGVAVYRAVNGGEDFIFVDFNKAGERIDNFKKEDLIGKSLLETFPDAKEFGLFDVMHRVWSTGNSEQTPVKIYKDGRVSGWRENYVYKLPSGEIVAVYDDITERIQAQEEMRKSEARYRALSEATFEAIFISENGICLDTNQRATELFEYDYNELIGIFGTDIIAAESKELVRRNMLSGYEKPYEAIAQKKDGTKFHVEIRGKMMKYEGKDVRMTVVRDINEQKLAVEALRES